MSYPTHTLPSRDDDINKPNIPPNAGPEVIDLEPTASVIDDGLLPQNRPDGSPGIKPGCRRGRRSRSDIPGFPDYSRVPESLAVLCLTPSFMVIMTSIALVAANLSQLKYALQRGGDGPYYYLILTTISLSIILQAAGLLGKIFRDLNNDENVQKRRFLDISITCVFYLIFVINLVTTGYF